VQLDLLPQLLLVLLHGLVAGMTVEVTAGVGAFPANTTVVSITSATAFVASAAPTTALSGGATVITATGNDHQIFTINSSSRNSKNI